MQKTEEPNAEDLTKIEKAKGELALAFVDAHGCDPRDAIIEVTRLPMNRLAFHVRKMSKVERAHRDRLETKRQLDSIAANAKQKITVFGVLNCAPTWFQKFVRLPLPPVVYLSERGANQAAEPLAGRAVKVVEIEVRA